MYKFVKGSCLNFRQKLAQWRNLRKSLGSVVCNINFTDMFGRKPNLAAYIKSISEH